MAGTDGTIAGTSGVAGTSTAGRTGVPRSSTGSGTTGATPSRGHLDRRQRVLDRRRGGLGRLVDGGRGLRDRGRRRGGDRRGDRGDRLAGAGRGGRRRRLLGAIGTVGTGAAAGALRSGARVGAGAAASG